MLVAVEVHFLLNSRRVVLTATKTFSTLSLFHNSTMKNSLRCFANLRGIILAVLAVSLLIAFSDSILALQVKSTGRFMRKGVVTAISAGQLTVRHYDGESTVYKIQDKDESAMAISGRIGSNPAEIMVKGTLTVVVADGHLPG